jgi:hypothetical protein
VTVTPVAASSAIPLMAADGVTAVNTAANYRQSWIGSAATPAPGGPMSWRPGVIPTATASGTFKPFLDLLVAQTATASTAITVGAGNCIIVRSGAGAGPYLVGFNSASTITLDPNPSTGSRYDVIFVQLIDAALGDTGTQGAKIDVVEGTASSTPVVPAIPTGAIKLAEILRPAFASNGSTNNVFSNQINLKRKSSGLGNGIRPLLEGDALSDPGSYPGEMSMDAVSSSIAGLRMFDGTIWHGVTPHYYAATNSLGTGHVVNGGSTAPYNNVTPFSVSIPDPGYPYRVQVSGKIAGSGLNNLMHWDIRVNGLILYQTYNTSTGVFEIPFPTKTSVALTGASTVQMVSAFDGANTTFTTSAASGTMYMDVIVLPDY